MLAWLPREAVGPPSLDVLKAGLDGILGSPDPCSKDPSSHSTTPWHTYFSPAPAPTLSTNGISSLSVLPRTRWCFSRFMTHCK